MRTIPWLTPKSIEFLKSFLAVHPAAMVLEFGSGGSTIWFAEHGVTAISIEHDAEWFDKVKAELKARGKTADLRLLPRPYDSVCKEFPDEFFDLVLVDGRDRAKCVKASMPKVKTSGVIMLDNAERPEYREIYSLLAKWEFFKTTHQGPDETGFVYGSPEIWETNWWKKPR